MNNDNTNDYSQAKIYKVWSPNHSLCYYGSTVQTLAERMKLHRSASNKATSKQIIDAGDADIALVEDYPCMNKYELEDREASVMQADWDGCVNANVAGAVRRAGGKKEYDKEKGKKYRQANPDKFKEYKKKAKEEKEKGKDICFCGGCFTKKTKEEHLKSKEHLDFMDLYIGYSIIMRVGGQ